MIFPIIFAIAGFVLGFNESLDMYPHDQDFMDYFASALFGFMMAILTGSFGAGLAALVGLILPKRWSAVRSYSLAAMNNGSGINGQFFLGRGNVNGGWAYHYYSKSGDLLRPEQLIISGNDVAVTETDDGNPRLEVDDYEVMYGWMNWFGFTGSHRRFRFFVPKGSVKEGFEI